MEDQETVATPEKEDVDADRLLDEILGEGNEDPELEEADPAQAEVDKSNELTPRERRYLDQMKGWKQEADRLKAQVEANKPAPKDEFSDLDEDAKKGLEVVKKLIASELEPLRQAKVVEKRESLEAWFEGLGSIADKSEALLKKSPEYAKLVKGALESADERTFKTLILLPFSEKARGSSVAESASPKPRVPVSKTKVNDSDLSSDELLERIRGTK